MTVITTGSGETFVHVSLDLTTDQYRALVNLVDNAWRMADEYLKGREPGSESETKAVIYQLTIESIQDALRRA